MASNFNTGKLSGFDSSGIICSLHNLRIPNGVLNFVKNIAYLFERTFASCEYAGGMLIVCPASLTGRWEFEIQKHEKKDELTFHKHPGNNHTNDTCELCHPDVVITIYGTITSEHGPKGDRIRIYVWSPEMHILL